MKNLENCIFFFLKFGKKEHIEALQKGNIYMKNVKYFKELEKVSGKRGMGDKNEGSNIMNDVSVKLVSNDNRNQVIYGTSSIAEMSCKENYKRPIFCMSYVDIKNIKIKEKTSNKIKGTLFFTDEEKKEFIDNFGEYVLIIPPIYFLKAFKQSLDKKGLILCNGAVKYSDFSKNDIDRIIDSMDFDEKVFFWKDSSFKNQKEYRIVILNKSVDDKFEINIGDMTKYSTLMGTEKFLNGNFKVIVNK
ncbi:hypothetical protein ACIR03_02635 [Clostridium cochlearium]|uniref:hypothetical protein n=1 Tax=Clostridium cochlearium TaxID=1494 RepID=UPI001EDF2801|nr:hypothetical protein [Clostridium cochlearium]MBV1816874.1 hypothetical protein [Bacteroidales bacterium MSK.15.36]MCG4571761.1 hypothetical protein [Clostridium cochlearium]MCG4579090.1 hypothetical protein [Clostridium cochlearium]